MLLDASYMTTVTIPSFFQRDVFSLTFRQIIWVLSVTIIKIRNFDYEFYIRYLEHVLNDLYLKIHITDYVFHINFFKIEMESYVYKIDIYLLILHYVF